MKPAVNNDSRKPLLLVCGLNNYLQKKKELNKWIHFHLQNYIPEEWLMNNDNNEDLHSAPSFTLTVTVWAQSTLQ